MRTHFAPKLVLPVSERDHIRGPSNAPVTLVEYADYQCPYCGLANPIVDEVRRELGDGIRFVFRNFPLSELHPHAEHAAEVAEAAGSHNKFGRCTICCIGTRTHSTIDTLPNTPRH
jgi:protein-disulfide isomerase